jgi:hypothetical protein
VKEILGAAYRLELVLEEAEEEDPLSTVFS